MSEIQYHLHKLETFKQKVSGLIVPKLHKPWVTEEDKQRMILETQTKIDLLKEILNG